MSTQNVYVTISRNFIPKGWNLKTNQMFINRWVGKQIMGDPYGEMLLSTDKEQTKNILKNRDKS